MGALTHWVLNTFASPVGIVVLTALDATLFVSLPFGIDVVVIILAARSDTLTWIVPCLATAGSVGGAVLTFWMGIKIGEQGLERWVSPRRLERVRRRIKDNGAIALASLALIPPPFPFTPFVLAAGALKVRGVLFFATLAGCRLIRFGLEALLARRYGRQIVAWLDTPTANLVVGSCFLLAVALTVVSAVRLYRSTNVAARRAAA
jgi:membrane protein YqaA with SNARE-associated domain